MHFWVGSFCGVLDDSGNNKPAFPGGVVAASDTITLIEVMGNQIPDKSWMLYLLELFNSQNIPAELNLICSFNNDGKFDAISKADLEKLGLKAQAKDWEHAVTISFIANDISKIIIINMKIVDLTLEITSDMITFPGYPLPTFIKWSKFDTQGYISEVMFLGTHTGTHMDAPFHFNPYGQTIDQVEVNRYICNNAILMKIQKNSNETISSDDIIRNSEYEIKEKDTVVFSTGWENQIKEKDNYIKNNPGLSKDAAEYLVEKKVNAIGIDCPSIDIGTDSGFIAHKTLLSNQILVVENLCNLYEFTDGKFTLLIAPLKLAGASGSPIRAMGIEE